MERRATTNPTTTRFLARPGTAVAVMAAALLTLIPAGSIAVADDDADRVTGAADRCPGTPAGAAVDERGCEFDSDGDGVVDRVDECPGTARAAPVTMRGCEHDSDSDGIPDHRDRCPSSTPGERITARGCTFSDTLILEGLTFESGSATPSARSLPTLDDVAETLDRYPGLRVEVAGHTDSRGDADDNADLSERRARAVVAHLVRYGIDPGRLSARGYGESQPIADNRYANGRAQNRRVEIRVQSD